MPKVSVCIPTFNRSHLLPFAIDSVLRQTYSDWELIVCDDGSTDDTAKFMAMLSDDRIRYLRHPHNIGKSNNMRAGFEAATGEYFLKFDDDDRLTPEFLERTCAILDQHPTVDFVGTDHWIINAQHQRDEAATASNSQKWQRTSLAAGNVENLLEVVFVHQSFQIGATLFRHAALRQVNFMRPDWQNCEDNDLFVRLALAHKTAYYLPDRLMEYRVHPEQQGTQRAIAYLTDKIRYLESFEFPSNELETIRRSRLAESQLLLGLRLVEVGEDHQGRSLLQRGRSASASKAHVGLWLSRLPLSLRQPIYQWIRR
ncbi:MAG: glycosyltransferase family 2 protein [Leptolyngbyaceae cyanobacterium SL_7_1]|nr:glycosyltransferase family 2 protein [Leptolyngbyaceae cyanobacterium SL_7_1]